MKPRKTFDTAVIDFVQAIVRLLKAQAAYAQRTARMSFPWTWNLSSGAHLAKDGPATTAELPRRTYETAIDGNHHRMALEEMGIVERKPHPTDGRQVNIRARNTASARRHVAMRNCTPRMQKLAWLAEAIAQLYEQERETLFRAGEIIMRLA